MSEATRPAHGAPLNWQLQRNAGALLAVVLCAVLWAPVFASLVHSWQSDPAFSHGPLVLLGALGLLWMRREQLGRWDSACIPGLVVAALSGIVHVAAEWTDVAFLKPLSLITMTAGVIWYAGGTAAFRASVGALGFLAFMVPWPTTVTDRIGFPMQLASSSYAALLSGLLGLPIVRDGVQLHVVPTPDGKPIFSILIAQQCSGLASLVVLLAAGYLIAYHTPLGIGWRALLVALVVPVALLTNAVRLTLVLLAGAYYSHAFAIWVHDHEAPVLVFFSSLCLFAIRHALMTWQSGRGAAELALDGEARVEVPVPSA